MLRTRHIRFGEPPLMLKKMGLLSCYQLSQYIHNALSFHAILARLAIDTAALNGQYYPLSEALANGTPNCLLQISRQYYVAFQ